MTQPQKDWTEALNDAFSSIHFRLQHESLEQNCVSCGSQSHLIRDVQIDHAEFYLTVPLHLCRSCSSSPPFPPVPSESTWRRVVRYGLDWFARRRMGATRPQPRPEPGLTTLPGVLKSIPQYAELLRLFPDVSLSLAGIRGLDRSEAASEGARFLSNSRLRRSVSYLMNADEAVRSNLPQTVLTIYPEIVDNLIMQSVATSWRKENFIVQIAAVLLPGRIWQFDTQIVTSSRAVAQDRLLKEFERVLQTIPSWSVAYPVVFTVRRIFGTPTESLDSRLLPAFDRWSTVLQLSDPVTYCEMAMKVHKIVPSHVPFEFEISDCEALCRCLPGSVALRVLYAKGLRVLGRYVEELEIYDRLSQEFPDDEVIIHERILALANAGQFERAAFECQRRIERQPTDAAAHALLAKLQLTLQHPHDGLKQIDIALALGKTADFCSIRANILTILERYDDALSAANLAILSDLNCASAYLLRAKLHLRAGRKEQALADLSDFERCAGISHESLNLQSEILVSLGRVGEAEQLFQSAIRETPHNLMLKLQWAEFLGQIGKLESARQACDQVIEVSDQIGEAYCIRAAIELEMGQFEEAVRDADRGITIQGSTPKAYLIRGLAKASLGTIEAGLEDLDTCVEHSPEYSIGRLHRARLRLALEEYESAIEDFSAALDGAPNWTEALLERGYAWLRVDDHEKARDDFERVIQLSPERAEGYTGRALTYLVDGKKAAASQDLNKAIDLDPSNLNSRLNRAKLRLDQTEMDLAREDLNEILAVEPKNGAALWQRAYVHLYQGRFSEAQKDFDLVIEMNPNIPQSLIGRSVAFELAGDVERAEADREEARRLGDYSPEQLTNEQILLTASVAASNEQFDLAIELTTGVIDEQSDPPWEAYRTRGHAHWYCENFVEALDDYGRILDHSEDPTRHDYSAYGQILSEMGEFERGLESLDRSIEIARESDDNVGMAYSLNGRARALAGLGRLSEAEQAFVESQRLKPNNAWLHYNRGLTYFEQNELAKSLESFEQALLCASPKLPPAKRRRVAGFIEKMRKATEEPTS